MTYRFIIAACLAAVFGGGAPVHAAGEGFLDAKWLSGRITTTIHKAIDWSGPGPWDQLKNVKIDSGKDNCYVRLNWGGPGSFVYDLVAYCLNGNGLWERGEYNPQLWELNDGKRSIGSDLGSLYFAQKGKTFHGFPENHAFIGYDGAMVLTPKFDKNGNLSSVVATVNAGSIYSWDSGSQIGGTSRAGGLKLSLVNTDEVPQGAIDCAAGTTPLCTETKN